MQSAAVETLESRLLLKANPMGTEYTVNSYVPGMETLADTSANAIASDHDGNYVVTWTSTGLPNDNHDGSFSGVYARLYQADGTPIGTEFRVNSTTFGHQFDPTVGMNDTGEFVIAWTAGDNQDGSLLGVYAQQFAADGTKMGGEFQVNSATAGNQTSPSVAVSADGSFVIVWQDTSPTGGAEIHGQNYLSSRAPNLGEFVVNSSSASTSAGNCSVSMADDNSYVVAWSSTGSSPGVYTRMYSLLGTPAAPESRVTPNGGGKPIGLDVDSNGNFVVTWLQGSDPDVFVRKFDATGAGVGSAFQVNTPTASGSFRIRTAPRVGLADSGRVFVTWMEATPLSLGFKNFGIWMREFRPDRSADGVEFQVNTIPAGQDGSFGPSSVSVDGFGDIRVVWQTDVTGSTGNTNDIHGQNFNRAHRPTDITLTDYTVDENLSSGTVISALTAVDVDPGDSFSWNLVPGLGDNGYFSIDPFGNELATADTFDFEAQSTYSIVIEVTDSWQYIFQKTITISINNINEAPNLVTTQLTVPENSPQGFQVGKIMALDQDFNQSLSYSITSGNANGAFALNPATGMLTIATPSLINFEAQPTITLAITVNDNGSPRKGAAGNVIVKITNVNEKPTAINLVPSAIPENQLVGTMVGTFATVDPDNGDTFTYSLVTGTGDNDNALFAVSGNQLQSAAVFDFETKASYKVRVRTTDANGLFFEKALVIGIINQNEQPTISNASFNVPENSSAGTVVGQLTAGDVDVGSVLTYSIVSGNATGAFAVNPSGQVVVADPAALDFETTQNFALVVRVSDSGNPVLSQTANVAVSLTNVFEAPTAVNLSPATVLENQSSGTLIGTLSTIDSDNGETYTYALVSGAGAINNGQVNIVGNQLFTTATLNRETQPTLNVRVLTTDSHGLAFEQPLTITVANVNEDPTSLQLSAQTVVENRPGNTLVGSFTTTDPDVGDGFTYSLVSGPGSSGNSQFAIVGDQLLTNAVFDYEGQNSYSILVRTTDFGGLSFDQTFIITITDVNDRPQLGNAQFAVTENSASGLLVGTLTATDADPGTVFTYMLTGGNTQGAFSIDPSTGELKIANAAAINYEAKQTYNLTVTVFDNGTPQLSASAAVTVNVQDVNEAPTSLSLSNSSVDENLPVNTTVGQFVAIDPDAGNILSYSLVAGAGDTGNSQFHIVNNQLLTSTTFDRETQSTYSIRARVTDQDGLSLEKILTITVNNVNEGPTTFLLLPSTVPEVKPAGIKVGNFVTTDVDVNDTFTYTLQSGAGADDNGIFIIIGDELLTTTVLDFESLTTYSIRVRTTDAGGLSFEQPVIVDVSNRNEAPSDIRLSSVDVEENQPARTPVGNFSAIDQDLGDQFTYSLVAGIGSTDNAMFIVEGGQLLTAAPLDFETHNTYFIRVQATDLGGKTYQRPLTIHVSDDNDAPTDITLSPNSIAENAAINTVVGDLSTTDPDYGDSFTYSLVPGLGGDDNASFQVSGQQITLRASLDFELKHDYLIRVQAVDRGGLGLSVQKAIVIHVSNANDAPTGLILSKTTLAENSPQGTEVGTFQPIDPDAGDTFSYSLVTGVDSTDNSQFLISGNRLLALTKFNAETQPTRSIRVRVTDAAGLNFEQSFVIVVTNVNEPPTAVALSSATVPENQPIGTVVGNLSTTDVDVGDTFTYTLVPGAGDTDNAAFGISGQQLVTAASFNFEAQRIYHVRVRTTDAAGLSFERALTIEVTNVNEAPTELTLGTNKLGENLAVGTRVGTLQGTDPDSGDVLTYSLVAGADDSGNGQFQIVGNELRTASILDHETHPTYSVRIRVSDSHGATLDQVFSVIVEDGAEPPVVHLTAATRAALRRQTVVLDEQATLVDDDSPTMNGGGLSIAVTGGATSDVLKLRNGSLDGVAWKVIRGGRAIQVGTQTVATMEGGTGGQPLVIHFQTGVSRSLAEAFLRNITFRGKTAGTRTATIRATDNTARVSEPVTQTIEVT